MTGITVHRIEDGRIAEEWEMPDNLGMIQQIGAVPAPEQPESNPETVWESGQVLSAGLPRKV